MDNSNYSRNKPQGSKNVVDNEVSRLFKKNKGKLDQNEFSKLRSKYNDEELVDKIQATFMEKHRKIVKKAKKFARLIKEKYSNSKYPFHILLEKALLYKKKHNLSDEEFSEFKRIYEQELVGYSSDHKQLLPQTNLAKVLGTMNQGFSGKLKVSEDDYKHLQSVLRMYQDNKALHAQVMLQSIQYEDLGYEAISGAYHREDHAQRPGDHIHPIVAALFLPKIPEVEEHFLYSNMAGVIKARYNDEPLSNKPDYLLLYSLTTDPNDVVCSTKSPVLDLVGRCSVQAQLWNSVLHLRNGQYYNSAFREFVSAVDACRLNRYDNPDLVYGRHDGTIIKRLLSAFSFRPTVVATSPVYQVFSTNPYHQNVRPSVSSVPMINLKLPISVNEDEPIELDDALSQTQHFFEGNMVVPKHTELIYSRGLLVFYVDRRAHVMKLNNVAPFNLGSFPSALAGFERINDRTVNFNDTIKIRDDQYQLRSVVVSKVNNTVSGSNKNIVTGSSTLLMKHADPAKGIMTNSYAEYDPLSVVSNKLHTNNQPMGVIEGTPGVGPKGSSFIEKANSRGTVFIYQLVRDQSEGVLTA